MLTLLYPKLWFSVINRNFRKKTVSKNLKIIQGRKVKAVKVESLASEHRDSEKHPGMSGKAAAAWQTHFYFSSTIIF